MSSQFKTNSTDLVTLPVATAINLGADNVLLDNNAILRGIALVTDGRPGQDSAIRAAAEVLDALDATELALLRRAGHIARHSGAPLFHCRVCSEPVHIRVRGVAASGETGGRRAIFVHDPRLGARFCPCGSLSDGSSAAAIDARRFNGKQEGQRHAVLKFLLQAALQCDPSFAEVGTEQIIRNTLGDWRKPDVAARTQFGPLGFDVQLAAPLLTSILGREQFYANAEVGHCWIVDAADPGRLLLQGFQDVVLPQGTCVFGFDERAAAITAQTGELTLHLMSLTEDAERGSFSITSELIGRDLILDLAGLRHPSAAPIARDLRASALFTALKDDDARSLQASFEALAERCSTSSFGQAQDDALFSVIAVLATCVMGRKADASRFADTAVNAVINHHLRRKQTGLRPNFQQRAWAPVIARAAFHPAVRRWIDKHGTQTRVLLDASLAECAKDPEGSHALIANWAPLLDRLFPGLRLLELKSLTLAPPP
jgi:hypothetical protein